MTESNQATTANPRSIVGEIVIWLDYPADATPVGTHLANLSVSGVDYELFHTPNHGDRGNGTGWDLFYFRGPNQRLRGSTELQPFLASLVRKSLIGADRFVASVELGDELMSGTGTTWVEDFDVAVDPHG